MSRLPRNDSSRLILSWRFCRRGVWILLTLGVALLPARPGEPRLLPHFYYVNEPPSFESLQANFTHIGLASAQWFTVDRAGALASTVDPSVVAWAKARALPLMPLLVNDKFQPEVAHAVLSDEQTQARVADQILEALAVHRFYGLELDFENIPPGDRGDYTRFVGKLARALHRHRRKLSVAVPAPLAPAPANPSWTTNPHSLGFDYKELGKVADFITLMAYDEYTSSEQPGPIAGLTWVEACLQQTLEVVPRNKLLLGLPLYHRHWSGKSVSEGPYEEAVRLATRWGVHIEMDPDQKEQTFKFEDGQTLHVVWLHGAPSLEDGVDLVRKYRLAGFSAWRLGQEDPAAWQTVFPAVRKKRP